MKIRELLESNKLLESFPGDFNEATNAAEAKKAIGNYLSREKGISAENLDIGSYLTEITSNRDPRLKTDFIIWLIRTRDQDYNQHKDITATDAGKVLPSLNIPVEFKGHYSKTYRTIIGYDAYYVSQYSWRDLILISDKAWALDLDKLEKDVAGLHADRVASRQNVVDRHPNLAGTNHWGTAYDKSGYAIDTGKYRRMLDKIHLKADKKAQLEDAADKIDEVNQIMTRLLGKDYRDISISSIAGDYDNFRNAAYELIDSTEEYISKLDEEPADSIPFTAWGYDYTLSRFNRYYERFKKAISDKLDISYDMNESVEDEITSDDIKSSIRSSIESIKDDLSGIDKLFMSTDELDYNKVVELFHSIKTVATLAEFLASSSK